LVNSLEKRLILSSHAVVVLTNKAKKILEDSDYLPYKMKKGITVIPTCVDTNKYKFGQVKNKTLKERYGLGEKFVFIYVGSLGTWYMLGEMIDFFRIARSKIPNAHFLILTQNPKSMVEKVITARGIGKEDFTIASSEPDAVPDHISLADAGVSFIKPCFSKQTSYPTKLGEYLASGLPTVINANVGDSEELIRNNKVGVVVNEFSDQAYMHAAKGLLSLFAKGDFVQQRARRVAEQRLSLDYGAEKYRRVYDSIIYK